jgi:hypothetical protein
MLFSPVYAAPYPRRPPFFGFLGKVPTESGCAHPLHIHAGVYPVSSVLHGERGRMRVEHSLPTESTPSFSTTYELPFAQLLSFDIHPSNGGCMGPPNMPTFKCAFCIPDASSGPADMPTFLRSIPFIFIFLCTLLHAQKTQLFCFQAIPHSLRKTPGGGGRGPLGRFHWTRATGHWSPIPIHLSRPIAGGGLWCHNSKGTK